MDSSEEHYVVRDFRILGFEARFDSLLEDDPERPVAVFFVRIGDLDDIGLTLSPAIAGRLLEAVVGVIRSHVPESSVVRREFSGVAAAIPDLEGYDVIALAEAVGNAFKEPIVVDDIPIIVSAKIGVAQYPVHGEDANAVLVAAALAGHTATKRHKRYHVVTEPDYQVRDQLRLILTEFLGALKKRELVPVYQPKIDLASGACVGVEALVRWQHPTRGVLGPVDFLPAVERTGLIHEMTLYVVNAVLRQLRVWSRAGLAVPVAVNLSPTDFLDSNLPGRIESMVRYQGLHTGLIEFEVTETVMMQDVDEAITFLLNLRRHGFRVAIDDFGTGHSSLSYLRDLPVSTLKLDRSFVRTLTQGNRGLGSLLKAFIVIARDLGMISVAEGIENEETLRALQDLGCVQGQGYHICRPLPAEELTDWLQENRG